MPSPEDIKKLSEQLHEDESSPNDERLEGLIGQLKAKNDEIVEQHDAAIREPLEAKITQLESQLTAANAKMEKLRDVLEKIAESGEYENNSLGNRVKGPKLFPTQMWWLAKQTLADTEEK